MNISKIHALRVSIYDKAGMIHVNPLSKGFSPTRKGTSSGKLGREEAHFNDQDADQDFEMELSRAIEQLKQNSVDYHA